MQRYFVKVRNNDNSFTLSSDDSYHITKVMRAKLKDLVEIVNDNTVYICEISSIDNNVKCRIKDSLIDNTNNIPSVTVAQSLVKEQKMDYILQKSTELGVNKIIPIEAERSIIKANGKSDKKIERWNKIVKEASEQSKRISIPKVSEIKNIKELIKEEYDYKILCSVNETSTTIKKVLQNATISDTILVVIGPEGGFTKSEEETLINNGFISTSLGNRVLRTETASSFVLSIINYVFMR